jgi:glycosyltransferase involved in cell wall biosynthesis
VEKRLAGTVRLLSVGRLERAKGIETVLRVVAALRGSVPMSLDLVGDGPDRPAFESLARSLGVADIATFHGWLPRPDLSPLYARGHMMLLPSATEGWPKVLSEGMAYGVVPLATQVGSIPQFLAEAGAGRTFEPDDVEGFAAAVAWYAAHPTIWLTESRQAVDYAAAFTYERYVGAVGELLGVRSAILEESFEC